MFIVGPEAPLVAGIVDFFKATPTIAHIPVLGPSKYAAQMEGSKEFAKEFMKRHAIPTAGYLSVTKDNLAQGFAFLETLKAPYVLKADGLYIYTFTDGYYLFKTENIQTARILTETFERDFIPYEKNAHILFK